MVKSRISGGIKKFFYETFRAHTKDEYADFMTRKGVGEYKTYPYLWVRALAIEIMVFAVALIVSEFTGYQTFYAYSVLIGGIILNIPVLILAYELYPCRDISFLKYFTVSFMGGVVAVALTLLTYYAYEPENEWLSALWTGFIEELFKAAPAIILIVAFKNRNPLFGFLIGAAVGAGVSVIEDIAYIHDSAGAWGFWGNDWKSLIDVSVSRSWTAFCTHTLWTALIGWAFCKFKKPLINFRFYLVAILCVALHFVWDMPLGIWWANLLVYIGCAVIGLVCAIVLLCKERKKIFGGADAVQVVQLNMEEVAVAEGTIVKSRSFGLGHIANLVAALGLSVIAVFTVGLCYSDWGFVSYKQTYFESKDELIDYLQGGMPIRTAEELYGRPYDDSVKFEDNYAYAYENKERVSAIQTETVTVGEYEFVYYYEYVFKYNEETNERAPQIDDFALEVNGEKYRRHIYYSYTGDTLLYFVKDGSPSVWYDDERQQYYIEENCSEYYYGVEGTVAVCSVMGLILIGGTAAFITLKIKERRKNNVG